MRITGLACAAALSVLFCSSGFALDAASDVTTPESPQAAPEDAAARSAKSIECSHKADAQNLHGKPRKQFMRDCKHSV